MSKLITLLILINYSFFTYAQSNLYPDTLNRDSNLDYVMILRDCLSCNPIVKNEPIYKLLFDNKGLNIERQGLDSLLNPKGRLLYDYEMGKLISYRNYNIFTCNFSDFDNCIWDSTKIAQKVEYEYFNNLISKIKWLNDGDRLSFDIVFVYNNLGKIENEILTEYSYPDIYEYQAFKPNSSEFLDTIKVIGNSFKKKLYKYFENSLYIDYYVDNKLTGKEYQKFNKLNQLQNRLVSNPKGDTLLNETVVYNSKGNVIEKLTNEIGYDGYGDSYDYLGYDKIIYIYDSADRLINEKMYSKNELVIIDRYEYHEK